MRLVAVWRGLAGCLRPDLLAFWFLWLLLRVCFGRRGGSLRSAVSEDVAEQAHLRRVVGMRVIVGSLPDGKCCQQQTLWVVGVFLWVAVRVGIRCFVSHLNRLCCF